MRQAWRRIKFLLRRRQMELDLAEEMRQHAAMKAEKNIVAGMTPQEAKCTAQRQLGNLTLQQEESRQSWGFPFLESVMQDIRYGLRGLRKAPGFTTVAVLTLALGIGSCTAIFSIVNAVLLRPLPYKDSSRMVYVWSSNPAFPGFTMGQSVPDINDIKALSHSFEGTTVYEFGRKTLTGGGDPEPLSVPTVTSDFFDFFSVHPVQGREFVTADEQAKNGDVVLLSYRLWQRRFDGDKKIVGNSILLDQKPYTVVGVLPKEFSDPDKSDMWVPLVTDAQVDTERRSRVHIMLAKLRPDVSLKNGQTEMGGIANALSRQHPQENSGVSFHLMTLQEAVVGEEGSELLALVGAVGFLLLIACANVTNLVLARGFKRQREVAVRAALGASRARIVRQLFVESSLLAFAGGVLGSALAANAVSAFRVLAPAGFPRVEELRVDPTMAMIAIVLTVLTGILCGLAPAHSGSRANLNLTLTEKTTTPSRRNFSLRGFLVIAEIASALILLTGSGLMMQSMIRLLRVDTGIHFDRVLSATLSLPEVRYKEEDAHLRFAQRLLDALRAQPQLAGVALSDSPLMEESTVLGVDPKTLAALGVKDRGVALEIRSVSPGFFETMGIPVNPGRSFNDHDIKGATRVAIINDSVARLFFPGQDPIGKVLKLGDNPSMQYEVIGKVPDTRDVRLQMGPQLQVYFALFQRPSRSLSIFLRTTAEPSASVAFLRSILASVDKDLPLTKVQAITETVAESLAWPHFRTWLLIAFALSGLALTLIGIYGVISYSVGQRTQEMGIRMALGAQQGNVLRLILREGVVLALAGAVCGLVGSFLLMWLLASQLYGIKPTDPATLAGATLLILIVALAASYIPARRATKVDPMIALRCE